MARGHKGRKPMAKERTRKLSNIENMMVLEGSAKIDNKGHVVRTEKEISAGTKQLMLKAKKLQRQITLEKEEKINARIEANIELRRARLKAKLKRAA